MVNDTAARVARALLEIGAVGFTPQAPIIFKSGLISPVYVDNRRLPFWPGQWQIIIQAFQTAIAEQAVEFDIIAGIEAAAIPHSSALAYTVQKPSVFVRKQAKDHGTKSRVEGGNIQGKKVLLIEDLVTTGGSSLSGVEALRQEGAIVENCLAIVSYGFQESIEAFQQAGVRLYTLTSFAVILQESDNMGQFTASDRRIIEAWLQDPVHWAKRNGFA